MKRASHLWLSSFVWLLVVTKWRGCVAFRSSRRSRPQPHRNQWWERTTPSTTTTTTTTTTLPWRQNRPMKSTLSDESDKDASIGGGGGGGDDRFSTNENDPLTSRAPPSDGSWTRQQLQLSVPAMLTLLADPLLSVVDTAFVGRLGTTALASLGACTSIFHLAFNTFRATTLATTSLVGPYFAANTKNQTESPFSTNFTTTMNIWQNNQDNTLQTVTRLSLQFGTLLGLAVAALLFMATTPILTTMGVGRHSPLYEPAAAYLKTRAWAAPCVAFTAVATGLFRGAGTTVIPLQASLLASALNLILDPLLMFGRLGWGVKGAAAATALSQLAATAVLAVALQRLGVFQWQRRQGRAVVVAPEQRRRVYTTIAKANLSMMAKQGSLLGAWAFCTAQATRLGAAHVAAHQVALSVWLVVALMLDSNAIGAQILASRYFRPKQPPSDTLVSLLQYQAKLAVGQGLVATALVFAVLVPLVPITMASDAAVQFHLQQLLPTLAWQQLLVSCTLVTEALAAATQQFIFLAVGTVGATVLSVWQLHGPTTVTGLWNRGIVTLFVGRWITASLALWRALRVPKQQHSSTC